MKKLSKEQLASKAEWINKLQNFAKEIQDERDTINALITDKLNLYIQNYNEILEEAATWRDEVYGEMDNFYDEKSDAWRESDSGQVYEEWKGELENIDLSNIDRVDEIDEIETNHSDSIESFPEEPL